jgi:hypothetical protein
VIPVRDVALITGLTMRLTRLVVSDDLGQWWVKDPLAKLAQRHSHYPEPGTGFDDQLGLPIRPEWARYTEGLDCPHCVSFHAAYFSLGSYLLARRIRLLPAWRFAAGTMSLSAVVGHVSARID